MTRLSEFGKLILPDVLTCPDVVINQAVIHTIVDFCERTGIFTKSFTYTPSTSDIEDAINDYVDVDLSAWVVDKVPVSVKEFKINGEDWELVYKELLASTDYIDDLKDGKQKLFYFTDTMTLRVYPIDESAELYFTIVYKPLMTVLEIDDVIYNDWVDTIVSGAKSKLLAMPDAVWFSPKAVNYHQSIYRSGISNAKRRIGKGFTHRSKRAQYKSYGE